MFQFSFMLCDLVNIWINFKKNDIFNCHSKPEQVILFKAFKIISNWAEIHQSQLSQFCLPSMFFTRKVPVKGQYIFLILVLYSIYLVLDSVKERLSNPYSSILG